MSDARAAGSDSMDTPVIQHRLAADGSDELLLAGVNDSHLKALARLGELRVILRSDHLILSGAVEAVERCTPVAQRMIQMAQLRRSFDLADVEPPRPSVSPWPRRPTRMTKSWPCPEPGR